MRHSEMGLQDYVDLGYDAGSSKMMRRIWLRLWSKFSPLMAAALHLSLPHPVSFSFLFFSLPSLLSTPTLSSAILISSSSVSSPPSLAPRLPARFTFPASILSCLLHRSSTALLCIYLPFFPLCFDSKLENTLTRA